MFKLLISVFCFTCLSAGAYAQSENAILSPILDVHDAQKNTGLAVVLLDQGKVAGEAYVGLAVVEHDIPVGANSRFQSMSVTKAFVGAILIKALSAGLVDLDAPVQEYLPDYPAPENGEITLRLLAAHMAGVPHLSHPARKNVYTEHFQTASASLVMFQDRPFVNEPGASYAYSSAGYTLIAAVLEAVYEKPFPAILQDVIAGPLSLTGTASGNVLSPTPDLVRNYSYVDIWTYQPSDVLQQVPTWDFSYNFGGGNLVTTARDLARFGDAFRMPGFFTRKELDLFYKQIDPEHSRWSYGWFVNKTDDGETYLSISGATPGVQAGLVVYPERGLVLSALSNAWGKNSAGGDLVVGAPQRVIEAYGDGRDTD